MRTNIAITLGTMFVWPGWTDRRRHLGRMGRRRLAGFRLGEARALGDDRSWSLVGQTSRTSWSAESRAGRQVKPLPGLFSSIGDPLQSLYGDCQEPTVRGLPVTSRSRLEEEIHREGLTDHSADDRWWKKRKHRNCLPSRPCRNGSTSRKRLPGPHEGALGRPQDAGTNRRSVSASRRPTGYRCRPGASKPRPSPVS